MADFVDPLVTAEIVAAKDKLVAQADRAEVIVDDWEATGNLVKDAPADGVTYGRKDNQWVDVAGGMGDMSKAVYDPTNVNGDAFARANHTGTQAISTVTGLQTALDAKLDAATYTAADVKTKYESNANTNAFTDAEQTKLTGIEAGAQVNKFDFTDAPIDGNEYVRKDGAWAVSTGGGGGATEFTGLTDTPANYTGAGNRYVKVNAAANALEFVDFNVDLGVSSTATTFTVTNTDGTDAIITAATTIAAGVMSASDKTKLDGVEAGAEVNNISDVNATDLTDAGDTTLHFHATDRDRANHTGTQPASTISDFDTEVTNNTAVALNTAKVSFPEAPIDGQDYVRNNGGWVVASGGSPLQQTIDTFDGEWYNTAGVLQTAISGADVNTNLANADVLETFLSGLSADLIRFNYTIDRHLSTAWLTNFPAGYTTTDGIKLEIVRRRSAAGGNPEFYLTLFCFDYGTTSSSNKGKSWTRYLRGGGSPVDSGWLTGVTTP